MAEGLDLNLDPNSGLAYAYNAQQQAGLDSYADPKAPYRMALVGGPMYNQYHQTTTVPGGGDDPHPVTTTTQLPGLPEYTIPKGFPVPQLGTDNGWGYVPTGAPGEDDKTGQSMLINPKLRYYDPNYGWVTPSNNFAGPTGIKKYLAMGADLMPYLAAGVATAGWGALLGPSVAPFIKGAIGAGSGLMAGGSPAAIAAGAAGGLIGGYSGLPGGSTIGKNVGQALVGGGSTSVNNPYSKLSQGNDKTMPTQNPVYPNGYLNDGNNFMPYSSPPDYTETINVTGQREPTDNSDPWGFLGEIPTEGWPPISGGGSSNNPIDYIGSFGNLGNLPNGGSDAYNRAALFGSALNDWYSSNQYMEMANKYADQMDPFGKQRGGYQEMLKKSYTDPTSFLNDPAHRAIQERQMAALDAKLGASGYMGSGLEKTQLADYLSTSDNQYLADEQRRLADLAGAQIGPSAAAGLIQTGITGSINARNNALANAARAFNPQTGPSTIINNNPTANGGGNSGGGGSGGQNPFGPGTIAPGGVSGKGQYSSPFGSGAPGTFNPNLGKGGPWTINGQPSWTPPSGLYDPVTGLPNNDLNEGIIDPTTGLPFGQPAYDPNMGFLPDPSSVLGQGYDTVPISYNPDDYSWLLGE